MRIYVLLFLGCSAILPLAGTVMTLSTGASIERDWWPDGTLQREARYAGEVRDGVYRTWYADGQPYEVRHYVAGREQGSQRAWTPSGELYLNYEMWNGRRYGYVNAAPCVPVVEEGTIP